MKKLYISLFTFSLMLASAQAQTKLAAANINAAGAIIEVPDDNKLDLGNSAFTIEAWIEASSSTAAIAPIIVCKKQDGTNANGWMVGMDEKGKLAFEMKGNRYSPGGPGGGWGQGGVTAIDLRDGKCHHIAFTREIGSGSDTIRGYQDGEYVKSSKKTAPKEDVSNNHDITIGGSYFQVDADYQFEGLIKEVRIWNVRRTEKQIDDNKGKWLKGNEAGLVAYWRLNDNSGSSAKDYAGGNNGIVKGGAGWSDFCNIMEPLPGGGTGIGDVNGADAGSIQVYPNPASGVINLKDLSTEAFEVKLFDMNGRLALTQSLNGQNTVDISSLESGVYMLLVNNANGTYQKSTISVK